MGSMAGNFMSQFKREYHKHDDSVELYSKHGLKLLCGVDDGDDAEYMSVNEPMVLAAFVAFCSEESREVYLRGSTRNYGQSVPSLFRDDSGGACDRETLPKRWSAYQNLLANLKSALKGQRWSRNNLGAVLQHYGIRTPWLDVVRNLYTAIWFASHEFETHGSCHVAVRSKQGHGWISLYLKETNQISLIVNDLKDKHSSRHLRPHVQHGMSLARQEDKEEGPKPDQDIKKWRVAQIRFPNSRQWRSHGHMFSTRFLFPAPEHDDSLRQLSRARVQQLLNEACGELGGDVFGSVTHYS